MEKGKKNFFAFRFSAELGWLSSGSLATLLSHVLRDSRLHVDRLHVGWTNDVAFWRVTDLFLRNNSVNF